MNTAIGRREVIDIAVGAACLRGTYHGPPDEGSDSAPGGNSSNRVGILFVNSLFMPRTARGDSAVYWADAFAGIGYPSFRVDLPGLGDSDGDLPPQVLDFVCLVNHGDYAPLLSGIVTHLVQRFGLPGVVLVGHCAGAVSALYAAAADGNDGVKGLVLLDPYFHLQQRVPVSSRWHVRVLRQLQGKWMKSRHDIHVWGSQTRLGGLLQATYRYFKGLAYRHIKDVRVRARRNTLPKNTNLPLIGCWERLASAGLPMLVLSPPARKPTLGEFDYLHYLQPAARGRDAIVFQSIEGVTHSLLERHDKESVREHTERWLEACFPRVKAAPRNIRRSDDQRETLLLPRMELARGVGGST
jgi:pimeloyl-ACP methyl ester carboxylesterase